MPLPSGVWRSNINGLEQGLHLEVNAVGLVQVQWLGFTGEGLWDEATQTISFALAPPDGARKVVGLFEGWLVRTPQQAAAGQDTVATLVGRVRALAGAEPHGMFTPNARRSVFGWFANFTEVQ